MNLEKSEEYKLTLEFPGFSITTGAEHCNISCPHEPNIVVNRTDLHVNKHRLIGLPQEDPL